MFSSALNPSVANSKRMKLAKAKAYGKKAAGMVAKKKAKPAKGKKPLVKTAKKR